MSNNSGTDREAVTNDRASDSSDKWLWNNKWPCTWLWENDLNLSVNSEYPLAACASAQYIVILSRWLAESGVFSMHDWISPCPRNRVERQWSACSLPSVHIMLNSLSQYIADFSSEVRIKKILLSCSLLMISGRKNEHQQAIKRKTSLISKKHRCKER